MIISVWIRTRPHEERALKLHPLADFLSPNVLDKAIISVADDPEQRQRMKNSPPDIRAMLPSDCHMRKGPSEYNIEHILSL